MLSVDVVVGPCASNYGGCSQFCWTTSSNKKLCECALGFFLASDGQTCKHRKSRISTVYIDSFWATVCKTVRPVLLDRCPVCLSVTMVYSGQTVGWIKMPLVWREASVQETLCWMGTQLPSPKGGQSLPIFSPCPVWPNGWMDQDVTWYAARPRPRRHCVRWRPSSPPPKRVRVPIFRPISVAAKWTDGSRCHLLWR